MNYRDYVSLCPHCHKPLRFIGNESVDIRELYAVWPEDTRKPLRKICRSIQKTIPSETRQSAKNFLVSIEECKPEVVLWALNQYHSAGHLVKGKGFSYLRAMILNHEKDRETLIELERKRLGGTRRFNMEEEDNER